MKLFILVCFVAGSAALPSQVDLKEWTNFKSQHNKVYSSEAEEQKRLSNFLYNLQFIREHNKKYENGEVTYTVAVNKFSDMTREERTKMNGLRIPADAVSHGKPFDLNVDIESLPKTVDWRTKGAVTPVKDQGYCGGCWAFSTTGVIEGHHFLNTSKLVSLSEEQLIDCSGKTGNEGCGGGWPEWALKYVKKAGGIDTEKSYPFEGQEGKCTYKKKNRGATINDYVTIPVGDEISMQKAVATVGPVSVCIDSSEPGFLDYNSGVYNFPNCLKEHYQLTHAVLVVGYGTDKTGGDYWLVKNSWGSGWGIDGYIMMSRNKDNQCGITTAAVYPVI